MGIGERDPTHICEVEGSEVRSKGAERRDMGGETTMLGQGKWQALKITSNAKSVGSGPKGFLLGSTQHALWGSSSNAG